MKFKQRGHVNNRIVCQGVKGVVGFESAKKRVFDTVIESALSCGWEIWTLVYELRGGGGNFSADMDFWRRTARTDY